MTTQDTCAGAFSGDLKHNWHSIDWASCHREVRRLQTRIVKATQEGRRNKVKALQWLLTHSFSGKALAVKRVTENQGKKTPGVDKIIWTTPVEKSKAILSLVRRGYQARPLRRVYIPKSNGKLRPLGIPTFRDRAMQALHLLALEPISETTADANSYGFRPERSTADAVEQCFKVFRMKTSAQWILEGDIKSCFDKISHAWMLENIPTDTSVLRKWLEAGYVENRTLFASTEGTPQGGIISPTLANMTLDGMERMLRKQFPKHRGTKVNIVRYCDDFVITGASKDLLVNDVKPLIEKFLLLRGMELSPEKTKITHIDNGFDFLGQNIRKYDGKLLIKPSTKNVKTFLDKVRGLVKENKSAKQISLINLLNPIIKGWANYHRHVVSSEIFHSADNSIWKCLWQWAKRRHPKKGKHWIKDKYFKKVGARNGVFAVEIGRNTFGGKLKVATLRNVSAAAIRRHIKIRGAANPFDPAWEPYFESRLGFKMMGNMMGRKKLLSIWRNQSGRCVVCHSALSKATGWKPQYIRSRCEGGKNNVTNLRMVHPNCPKSMPLNNLV